MKSSIQKGTENKIYIITLVVTTILLVVFFTSKLWMYDDAPIMQTPFNAEITGLDQTSLKLNKWEYNSESELMEVTLETHHTGDDVIKPTFTFEARERDSGEEYPIKVVYEDDTNIVLQLENVTEKYRIIGLFVFEHRDKKIVESELKESLSETEGSFDQEGDEISDVDLSSVKPAEKIIVGDYRKIKLNNDLGTKDDVNYQSENIERDIKVVEEDIDSILTEKIPLQYELIESLEDEVEVLENDLEYQTDEEQEESKVQISSKEDAIKQAKEEIEEMKLAVEKLVQKREKLEEKLESVQKDDEDVQQSEDEKSDDEVDSDADNKNDEKESDDKKNKKKNQESVKDKKQIKDKKQSDSNKKTKDKTSKVSSKEKD